MQQLIVRNFGPIRDVTLEVQDVMVFIGPSASGKSTLAKLLYILGDAGNLLAKSGLSTEVAEAAPAYVAERIAMPAGNGLATFLMASFPASSWQTDTCIEFRFGRDFHLKIMGSDISIQINDQFFLAIETFRTDGLNRKTTTAPYFNTYHFRYFFPAQRSLIAAFSASIRPKLWALTDTNLFPPLTQQYVDQVEVLLEELTQHPTLPESYMPDAQALASAILKGKYQVIKNQEFIAFDKHVIPLVQASSGQQETANLIERILLWTSDQYKRLRIATLSVIEEPEAHLFPEDQNRLMWLCAMAANVKGVPDGMHSSKAVILPQMILTTHSPYILTSLNNLMYAWQVGQESPAEVRERIPEACWLDPKRVGAYYMADGGITSIMDAEAQQIQAERIDKISGTLNDMFYELMDIKLSREPQP